MAYMWTRFQGGLTSTHAKRDRLGTRPGSPLPRSSVATRKASSKRDGTIRLITAGEKLALERCAEARSIQEFVLTRIAAITPAHREHLRGLKADFDRAYAAIKDVTDRSSIEFRTAESLYRIWIKAIDGQALTLLDDLDAFDIGGGGPRPEPQSQPAHSPNAPTGLGDVDHIFAEMEEILLTRDLIGESHEMETCGLRESERPGTR